MTAPQGRDRPASIEWLVARVLGIGIAIAVTFLAAGVTLMVVDGISPLSEAFPPLQIDRLLPDLLSLRPESFLWIGLMVLVATPIVRIAGESIGLVARGERTMAVIAAAILGVVALSVVSTLALEA
jgi:uncharacterized membrane protein